jgi:hypothetical protein
MGRNDEFVSDFGKEPTVIMPMMENWKSTSQISVPSETKKIIKRTEKYSKKGK